MCQEKLGKLGGREGGKERGKKDRDYGVSCPKMLLAFVFFPSFIISDILQL